MSQNRQQFATNPTLSERERLLHFGDWNAPLPPDSGIYAAALELAKPVASGTLPLPHALAAILAVTLQQERDGTLGDRDINDVLQLKQQLFHDRLLTLQIIREQVIATIKRTIAPLVAIRAKSGRILSEAHGCNGEAGFPLTEDEVTEVVRVAMYWAMKPARKGDNRYGR
jgi:hypothetical protein